ncbi:hypothetical protein CYMTET_46048 [Cymbomonas tetramitiformis]|uniref:Cyclic nucleotide-binding domain-containing protein n=1 Tax=Cymbomonas tetramitiformis TaxID=36881 RepID=A0AAE0BY90_9CHLO|nr:hypothetical protein CYMTET_46048 [Cymbomonas tetramitiformis]
MVQLYVALEGDLVITQGEIGEEMFIILQGRVEIVINGNQIGQLKKGDFFGEGGLLNGTGRRGASIRCLKMSIFYILEKDSFDSLRGAYPDDCTLFLDVAQRRVNTNKVVKTDDTMSDCDRQKLEEQEEQQLYKQAKRRSLRDVVRTVML